MPRPDGTTSPALPRPSQATTDDPFAPPTHYLFQDKKRRRAPPRHARIPSLLLNQFSSFEAFGSPPPTYSSQPPPPSPPVIIDHESVHSDSDDSASDDDARSLTHDGSKDILIERLSHIIRHLQITPETGGMVDELHSKVDEMYGVMGKFLCFDGHSTSDGNIFGPLSHTTQSRTDHTKPTGWTHHFKQEEDPLPTPTPTPRKSDMTPLLTAEITNLNTKLSTVLQSLRTRKEETDKIQSSLLTHLSTAATHIVTLESTISTLTSDLRASDSALRHLRLELRAVETLWRSSPAGEEMTRSMSSAGSSPRTPGAGTTTTTVDVELVRSIENWKADWRELRGRVAARRGEGGRTPTKGEGVGVETPAFSGARTGRLRGGESVLGSPNGGVAVAGRLRGVESLSGSPGAGATAGRLRGLGSLSGSPAAAGSPMGRVRGGGSVLGSPFRRPAGSSF